jgi:hypothetical protein
MRRIMGTVVAMLAIVAGAMAAAAVPASAAGECGGPDADQSTNNGSPYKHPVCLEDPSMYP